MKNYIFSDQKCFFYVSIYIRGIVSYCRDSYEDSFFVKKKKSVYAEEKSDQFKNEYKEKECAYLDGPKKNRS